MFFTFPENARWNAERQAVEFGVEIGEYHGVVLVPRRVFQRLLPERPTPASSRQRRGGADTRSPGGLGRKPRKRSFLSRGRSKSEFFRSIKFARDAGLRIDHLLLSPAVAGRLIGAGVDREVRAREKSSDHAPVWIELADTGAGARDGRRVGCVRGAASRPVFIATFLTLFSAPATRCPSEPHRRSSRT
jgi:hypothetical protein